VLIQQSRCRFVIWALQRRAQRRAIRPLARSHSEFTPPPHFPSELNAYIITLDFILTEWAHTICSGQGRTERGRSSSDVIMRHRRLHCKHLQRRARACLFGSWRAPTAIMHPLHAPQLVFLLSSLLLPCPPFSIYRWADIIISRRERTERWRSPAVGSVLKVGALLSAHFQDIARSWVNCIQRE
jgi:hypothetical protein